MLGNTKDKIKRGKCYSVVMTVDGASFSQSILTVHLKEKKYWTVKWMGHNLIPQCHTHTPH